MGIAGYVPAYHTGTLTTAYLDSIKGRINSEKLEKFTGGLGGLTETFFRYSSISSSSSTRSSVICEVNTTLKTRLYKSIGDA